MRTCRWLVCLLLVPLAVGLLATGCQDDDDEKDDVAEEADPDSPPPPPAQQTLKSGSTLVGTESVFNAGDVTAPGAGAIVARMVWDEAGQVTAYFKKSGPANYGWVKGDSVLTSTIDPVAKDDVYTLYIYNNSAANGLDVDYTVTFVPD